MPTLRQLEERKRTLATLNDEDDQIVKTASHRVALTSGSTMSQRQKADFVSAQNEVVVRPTGTTSSASVEFEIGGFSRVRDRLAAAQEAEVLRPKTQQEIDADEWLALHKRREAEAKAGERPAVNAYERQIAEAKAKVAADAARKAREEAERQQSEARGRQIMEARLKADARREILAIIATMSPEEEDAVTEQVQAMGAAYLSMPIAWASALDAVRARK